MSDKPTALAILPGAVPTAAGTRFTVYSSTAERVELCLFDSDQPALERRRCDLAHVADGWWSVEAAGAAVGTPYGFRVHGPWDPRRGIRHNPHKLLLDLYARAIRGSVQWHDATFAFDRHTPERDLSFDDRDSASYVPRSVVADAAFDWQNDRAPMVPWDDTVIYECHVKGMTRLHPLVPPAFRGTYLGLSDPAVIDHLRRLGVTAVELMPVHHAITRHGLTERGLADYWGYNTIGFFAPDARFATCDNGPQVSEFKEMVRRLHLAGIEVILDVVYNHTGEGDRIGPTLSFRGLDNAAYYRLLRDHPADYDNVTGCGNTLNLQHPVTLRLVMDSLRYWVEDMHVDGFRFDLATALIRNDAGIDPSGLFFSAVMQDPVLSRVKLIAEPWDATAEGYRVGSLPAGWSEWNDRYRDAVRRFWRGDGGMLGELSRRMAGSEDLFGQPRRGPRASINYVTCHDGFTLRDLVSYEQKHNEANGEYNGDGMNENHGRNHGAEGSTDDAAILAARERAQRNLIATLMFSLGTPMLLYGDEVGRSQRGNNNAYCQDNEVSWMSWEIGPFECRLLAFFERALTIRRRHRAWSRTAFLHGRVLDANPASLKDVAWLKPDGMELDSSDWHDESRRTLGMWLANLSTSGDPLPPREPVAFLFILHADERDIDFRLPNAEAARTWRRVLDTAEVDSLDELDYRDRVPVRAQSAVLMEYRVPS